MDFCFVHAADLHLDAPFEGVSDISSALAERLRDASLKALDNLVKLALHRRAAFLLLAGDIYDGSERGIRAQFRFLQAMRTLDEAGIPVFIVHGNHDPLDGWSAIRQWPDNVTVFSSEAVKRVPVVREGRTIASVYGISYSTRDVTANLASLFQRSSADGLHIGLLHCNAGGAPEHDRYSPCTPLDLARADMDYWALGHIHARRVFQAGSATAVYPGNTQGRSFKPSEQGPKGATVVTVRADAVQDVQFEPLDGVRFASLDVDIGPAQDWAALADALESQAIAAQSNADGRDLVLRAILCGRGPLYADLSQPERVQELLKEMRGRGLEDVHWSAIHNQTWPDFDREAIRGRGDFAAELVEKTEDLLDNLQDQRSFVAAAWQHPKALQLSKWMPEPDDCQRAELIRQAERRALDMVLARMEQESGQ